MANSRKRNAPPLATPPTEKTVHVSAFSLRLPDHLRAVAQQCADSTGISLNGLVCTALVDYLASRGFSVHPAQGGAQPWKKSK